MRGIVTSRVVSRCPAGDTLSASTFAESIPLSNSPSTHTFTIVEARAAHLAELHLEVALGLYHSRARGNQYTQSPPRCRNNRRVALRPRADDLSTAPGPARGASRAGALLTSLPACGRSTQRGPGQPRRASSRCVAQPFGGDTGRASLPTAIRDSRSYNPAAYPRALFPTGLPIALRLPFSEENDFLIREW